MRGHFVPWVALVSFGCLRPPPPARPPPLNVVDVTIEPTPLASDRVARMPVFVIHTDRDLAPAGADAAWVLTGEPNDALRTAGARGSLGATDAARRVDADISVEAEHPTELRIRPRQPLAPDTSIVLVVGAGLISIDGVQFATTATASRVIVQRFRVAPSRECPPIAQLAFPLATDVPLDARTFVVSFDRPVSAPSEGAIRFVAPSGDEMPVASRLSCLDPSGGARCLIAFPEEAFEAGTSYRWSLDGVTDDGGLAAQIVDSAFVTQNESVTADPIFTSEALVCALDEFTVPPFCVHADRGALVVRGQTTGPGALRVRYGSREMQSPAGIHHLVRLEPNAYDTSIGPEPLFAWPVALDGSSSRPIVTERIDDPPPRAPIRITEVLAHPHSTGAQEFVEIENVTDADFSVEGFRIATRSGSSPLPTVVVPARARAVIAGATFDPRGASGDPGVAPGTLLLRLDGTLAAHGLSDRGVDVWIADATGQVVTRAPTGDPSLAPRTGVSIVRADPRMDEDDPAGWSYDARDGSTPGLPDRLR